MSSYHVVLINNAINYRRKLLRSNSCHLM